MTKDEKQTVIEDPEVVTIAVIVEMFQELDENQQRRITSYLNERYGV